MDGRIGQLNCQYQVLGEPSAVASVKLRLDRLMQTDVVTRCETMLDNAFADDPTVYIVRQLDVHLTIADGAENYAIAKHWGEQIVRAVVDITGDTGDTQNVMTFRDQADYIAHFLMDLASGQAWNRWFYGAFAKLKHFSKTEALQHALDDHQDHFGQIMAYLYQYEALDPILSAVDKTVLRRGWSAIGGNQQGQPAQIQPLFALAFQLVDVLGWWQSNRPDEHNTFEAYYSASNPLAPDWQDSESLLQAVISVIHYLNQRGLIRESEAPFRISEIQAEALRQQYDWLDLNKLLTRLSSLVQQPDAGLPMRDNKGRITPRQRTLLEALKAALQNSSFRLDAAKLDASENAIRLLALLLSEQPEWADDSLTVPMLENLVQIWTLLIKSTAFRPDLKLSLSQLEHLLLRLSFNPSPTTAHALRFLNSTGEAGLAVLEVMLKKTTADLSKGTSTGVVASPTEIGSDVHSVDTNCAGIFLLARAVQDARLPALLDNVHYPASESTTPLCAALLTLALYWSGRAGHSDNQIDRGLLIWAGLEQPTDVNGLRQIWHDTPITAARSFQRSLLRLLIGQRVLSADALTLHRMPLDEHRTELVAGADAARIWPFSAVIHHPDDEAAVLSNWMEDWEAASGYTLTSIGSPLESEQSHLPDVLNSLKLEAYDFIEPDLTMILTANTLLRMWARWLGQFGGSSPQYLLTNFIRRPGRITLTPEIISVEIDSGPLDIVLQMAGYLSEIGTIAWLGNRRMRFHIREQS